MRSLIASGWHADGVPVRSIVDAGAEVFAVPLGGWLVPERENAEAGR